MLFKSEDCMFECTYIWFTLFKNEQHIYTIYQMCVWRDQNMDSTFKCTSLIHSFNPYCNKIGCENMKYETYSRTNM